MTRARLLILVSLAAVAAGALLFASRDASPPAEVTVPVPVAVPAVASTDATPANPPANTGGTLPTATIHLRPPDPMALNFAATDDLLAFIDGIQDAAQDGDGAAAYFVYRALDRCQADFARRFGTGRRERTLDEVLTDESVVRQFGVEDLRRIHGQCQRLRDSDITRFGEPDDWRLKASDAGFPRAQAEVALWYVETGGPPRSDWAESARELARVALRSKDPEVFLPVSRVIAGLNGEEAQRNSSWYVAACLRGLDCGPNAEITQRVCRDDPNCRPQDSLLDLIHRNMGERFDAIERDARAINDAVDAGRFEELGLQK